VWHSRAAAWWALLLGLTTPLFFSLGSVMTTDVVLLLLWTWGMWALFRALFQTQSLAWYEFGAVVGLAGLTKLSIVLLPLFTGVWLLLTPTGRQQLKTLHPWLAALLALALFSPVLLWNAQHDWVMFRHELGHVAHDGWSLNSLLDFSLTQIIALSPLVVLVAASVLWRRPVSERQRFLWYSSLFLLGFFLIKSFGSKVQINWAAPSYLGFLILFAGHLPHLGRLKRTLVYIGVFVSLLMSVIGHFPYNFGLTNQQDPFRKMRAWQEPVLTLHTSLIEADKPIAFILTDSYTLAGELAFYWPAPIAVYITGSATRRFNQHDLWPGIEREAGHNGLYVSTFTDPPAELLRAFSHCVMLPPVTAYAPDGAVLRTLYAKHCTDYQPIIWPQPSRY
ncbi:MAG: glycosyltransferase family 39 protein, partial [Gammaproteobacteria bacterium]